MPKLQALLYYWLQLLTKENYTKETGESLRSLMTNIWTISLHSYFLWRCSSPSKLQGLLAEYWAKAYSVCSVVFICLIQELGFCVLQSSFISYLDFLVDSTKKSLNRRQEDRTKIKGDILFSIFAVRVNPWGSPWRCQGRQGDEAQRGEKEKSIHLDFYQTGLRFERLLS